MSELVVRARSQSLARELREFEPVVAVHNCLPTTLRHYETVVNLELDMAGASWLSYGAADVEIAQVGIDQKLRAALRSSVEHIYGGKRRSFSDLLVLWPAFGFLELALWSLPKTKTVWVVIHDPQPLRRQRGLGRVSRFVGRKLRKENIKVVVHSSAARAALEDMGIEVNLFVPLPMQHPIDAWRPTASVAVLGQYKMSRDTELLVALGAHLRRAGFDTRIFGRGWPSLDGWTVHDTFLTEDDFDNVVQTAACVILPYKRLFQSEVAVRCAQFGVPVVGPRGCNLADLYGDDWPGIVAGGAPASDWSRAVGRVTEMANASVLDAATSGYRRSHDMWAGWLSAMASTNE